MVEMFSDVPDRGELCWCWNKLVINVDGVGYEVFFGVKMNAMESRRVLNVIMM